MGRACWHDEHQILTEISILAIISIIRYNFYNSLPYLPAHTAF